MKTHDAPIFLRKRQQTFASNFSKRIKWLISMKDLRCYVFYVSYSFTFNFIKYANSEGWSTIQWKIIEISRLYSHLEDLRMYQLVSTSLRILQLQPELIEEFTRCYKNKNVIIKRTKNKCKINSFSALKILTNFTQKLHVTVKRIRTNFPIFHLLKS